MPKVTNKRKSKTLYDYFAKSKVRREHELSPSPESENRDSDNDDWDTEHYQSDSDDSMEGRYWRTNMSKKSQTEQLKERLKLVSKWSQQDTKEYRLKYPDKLDMENLQDNYLFYTNQMPSKPDGGYIDDILETWKGDYSKLERHHGYIQWLFPIRERGMNWHSQELQLHEANKIIKDKEASARFLKAYELMLDFYGLKLKDKETGELERAANWEERLTHLNRSFHNYLRITRILKSMGELGLEHMKYNAVRFFLHEAIHEQTIPNAAKSCVEYWVHTLRDNEQRNSIIKEVRYFVTSDESQSPSRDSHRHSSTSPEPEPSTSSSNSPVESPKVDEGNNKKDDEPKQMKTTKTAEATVTSSSGNTQQLSELEPDVELPKEQASESNNTEKVEEACEALSLENNKVDQEEKGHSGIDKVDSENKDNVKTEDKSSDNEDSKPVCQEEDTENASAAVNEQKDINDDTLSDNPDIDHNKDSGAQKSDAAEESGGGEKEKTDSEPTSAKDPTVKRVTRSQVKNANV